MHPFQASSPQSVPEAEIIRMPSASETLVDVLTRSRISSARLLESLYYAAEDNLFIIMRLVAALEPSERAKVLEYARALQGNETALALLLNLPAPASPPRPRRRKCKSGAPEETRGS